MSQSSATECASTPSSTCSPNDATAVVRHLAHELRQPLSTIESIGYYLKISLPPNQVSARQQAEKLQEVVDQASSIIADAVFFLEAPKPRLHLLDLNEFLSHILAQPSGVDYVHARVELCERAFVRMDPAHAQHLVLNLLRFFRHVVQPVGSITIHTESLCSEIVLSLSAVSSSMASDDLLGVFEPFNQSLPSGVGLTMASARRIVEVHGGRIEAHSHLDQGVSIVVAVPAA
jgi:signal transduction histidine kinase